MIRQSEAISYDEAKRLDPNDVAYYTLNDGSVKVVNKPGEVVPESDIIEVTENDTKNYRRKIIGNEYRVSRRSRTPAQRKTYAGVVEERRNYKFYASGTATIPGEETEEIITEKRNCTCARCPYCHKIKRTTSYVTGEGQLCCECGGSRILQSSTVPVKRTTIRRTVRTPAPRMSKKVYKKIIQAVPIASTEYETEVVQEPQVVIRQRPVVVQEEAPVVYREYVRAAPVVIRAESPIVQTEYVSTGCADTCIYCGQAHCHGARCSKTVVEDTLSYCPKCSCRSSNVYRTSERLVSTNVSNQPPYLDNYRYHEIQGTSGIH